MENHEDEISEYLSAFEDCEGIKNNPNAIGDFLSCAGIQNKQSQKRKKKAHKKGSLPNYSIESYPNIEYLESHAPNEDPYLNSEYSDIQKFSNLLDFFSKIIIFV